MTPVRVILIGDDLGERRVARLAFTLDDRCDLVDDCGSVGDALGTVARREPDAIAIAVGIDQLAEHDALRRLHAAAPAARLVLANSHRDGRGTVEHTDEGMRGVTRQRQAAQALIDGAVVCGPGPAAGTPLAPATPSIAAARRVVADACDGEQGGEAFDTARLVASELVTNAVLHAGDRVVLAVQQRPGTLRIAVSDGGRDLPAARPHSLGSNGRGMHVVARLAAAWGIDPGQDGKTVWADVATSCRADLL